MKKGVEVLSAFEDGEDQRARGWVYEPGHKEPIPSILASSLLYGSLGILAPLREPGHPHSSTGAWV